MDYAEIKKQIANNKIQEAINQLITNKKDYEDELIILLFRDNLIEKLLKSSLINVNDYFSKKTILATDFLSLIKNMIKDR